MKSMTDLGSGPPPRYTGSADPRSHPSRTALEHHLRFFPNCFFFFFVASLAFRGVVGSVVERHRHEVRRARPKIPAHPSPASLTQGTPLKESQSWAVRMGGAAGRDWMTAVPSAHPHHQGAQRGLGDLPGAQGHEHMTEWARSKKELCRPEGEGDREVRSRRGRPGPLSPRKWSRRCSISRQRAKGGCVVGEVGRRVAGKKKSRAPQGQESPDL